MAKPAFHRLVSVILCALMTSCRQNYVDADNNRLPVAVARAVDANGMLVDSSANDGLGPFYPFAGEPVEVELDGTASHDSDGRIVRYRWLGTGVVDAGSGRLTPEGEEAGWPDDKKQLRVRLGQGTWSFSLWVTDDDGATSDPSEINVVVGDASAIDAGTDQDM